MSSNVQIARGVVIMARKFAGNAWGRAGVIKRVLNAMEREFMTVMIAAGTGNANAPAATVVAERGSTTSPQGNLHLLQAGRVCPSWNLFGRCGILPLGQESGGRGQEKRTGRAC